MTKTWIAINAALLLLAGGLGWRLNTSAKNFKSQNDVTKIQPVRTPSQKITLEGALPPVQPPRQYDPADFAVIPAQNLFSDTRTKEEKVEAAPAVQEIPPLQVRPILVGVTLAGGQKMASVVDPTAGGSPRRSQTRRLGDTFQGYTITDITMDQMVLERGNRREVIPLFDASKHPAQGTAAQGGRTPIVPTRVIAFGGGGVSGQGTAQPVSTGPRSMAAAGSSSGGQVATPAGASSPGRTTPAQQVRQMPAAPSQTAPATGPTDQQGRRVIRTPFGDVPVRPEP
jgi:hypothetical protein